MRKVGRAVLANPLIRVLLAVGVLLVLIPSAERETAAPTSRAGHAHAQGHPLTFDAQLGMYGHSDHVGTRYPFSEEALSEIVPDRALAAGRVSPQNAPLNPVEGKREVVHLEPNASDAQADATETRTSKPASGTWRGRGRTRSCSPAGRSPISIPSSKATPPDTSGWSGPGR